MKTILIVEHDKRERQQLRTMIQKGHVKFDTILECRTSEEALFIMQHQKIDIMCTALLLPNIDGVELINQMQTMKHKPQVIVASTCDSFAQSVKLLRLGVREYLLKPVQKKQLDIILSQLDAEITLHKEHKDNNSTVNGQYLKQMLLRGSVSKVELESIERQSNGRLFSQSYVVCCLDNMGLKSYMREDRGYLGNVEQSELYIIKSSLLEKIRKQEWRRRYVGVSESYTGIEHLQRAYETAKQARVLAFYQSKSMVFSQDIKESDSIRRSTQISIEQIQTQINKLSTSKSDTAVKYIKNLLWENSIHKDMNQLQEICDTIFDSIQVTYPTISAEEKYDIHSLKSPLSYPNIMMYEHALTLWIDSLIEKVKVQLDDFKSKQKMEQAVEFIQANYTKDFNMAVVSNEVSMNYTLFSLAFKEFTGTNFVSYLKNIRMKKAKEYLEKTDMKIAEISQQVGYENEKHFMKTFKVLYGVSPTEYRKSLQLK